MRLRPGSRELAPVSARFPAATTATAAATPLQSRRRRRAWHRRAVHVGAPYALLVPTALVIAGVLGYPLYNLMYGPPVFAPLLFAASGFLGLLASLLRRAD